MDFQDVIDERQRLDREEREFAAMVREVLPIGKTIAWKRNGIGLQSGKVMLHGFGRNHRLKVYNFKTRRQYWITLSNVIEGYHYDG